MKKLIRVFTFLLLAATITSSAFGQGGTLQLQGSGGSFTAPLDPQGNATILNVKPGTYQLYLLVPAVQKVRLAAAGSPTNSPSKPGELQIESWSWGTSQAGSANGGVWKTQDGGTTHREASTPSVSEIVVTKNVAATHTKLDQPITFNGQECYRIKLQDILVSSASGGGGGAGAPAESVSLNFTKITYTVR